MAIRQMTREEYEKEFGAKPTGSAQTTTPQNQENKGNFGTGLIKS